MTSVAARRTTMRVVESRVDRLLFVRTTNTHTETIADRMNRIESNESNRRRRPSVRRGEDFGPVVIWKIQAIVLIMYLS
jgi:hypothetical protein